MKTKKDFCETVFYKDISTTHIYEVKWVKLIPRAAAEHYVFVKC